MNNALQNSPDMHAIVSQQPQNALMPQQAPQPQTPQLTPQQVSEAHSHIDDTQNVFKELLQLPDEELTLGRVLGAASDLVVKYNLSHGKKGASPMQVAAELGSKDFPNEGPNGEKPSPQALRKYLLNHFNKHAELQALLTHHFGPPQPQAPTPENQKIQQNLSGA